MIINTDPSDKQSQTIEYIRKLTLDFAPAVEKIEDLDSLALSYSEPDSLNIQVQPVKKKRFEKSRQSHSYVSPYKQSCLSIKKITEKQRKKELDLSSLAIQNPLPPKKQKRSTSESSKKGVLPAKYMQVPHRYLNEAKNLTKQVRAEARQIYARESIGRGQYSNRQKKQRWADFLLRQRKWQSQKQDKKMIQQQMLLQRERQAHKSNFTPRQYPRMSIDDHIRLINRKKTQLKQELKSNLLNYYTWQSPYPSHSPQRQRIESKPKAKCPMIKSAHNPRQMIQLQSQKQLKFLIDKTR